MPQPITPLPAAKAFAEDERAVLLGYLAYHRAVLARKVEGLRDEQARLTPCPPSTLTLLGLIRHLARVEHNWFRRVLQGQPHLPKLYVMDDDPDLDFNGAVADPAVAEEAWTAWRREVKNADAWLGKGTPFDEAVSHGGDDIEVRDVLVHLVEEYARHVGHADLLRECIDGRTGQ